MSVFDGYHTGDGHLGNKKLRYHLKDKIAVTRHCVTKIFCVGTIRTKSMFILGPFVRAYKSKGPRFTWVWHKWSLSLTPCVRNVPLWNFYLWNNPSKFSCSDLLVPSVNDYLASQAWIESVVSLCRQCVQRSCKFHVSKNVVARRLHQMEIPLYCVVLNHYWLIAWAPIEEYVFGWRKYDRKQVIFPVAVHQGMLRVQYTESFHVWSFM